ncbi:MAG: esterase [Flavobacteriaceae bacterium]|nr:esterase [Flavobacteriaceae bacterium]|tara:strand:+ start:114 stop:758 length:645 start_codon:yes stop_codon:yes gene_type:complete
MATEHEVSYTSKNTYTTLHSFSETTENVWLVFHGMGYLSRYFGRYFTDLDPASNYVIAPQAPSKYYLKGQFTHVGASWLTREQTELETENVLAYVDAVWERARPERDVRLFVLGYSQGVSIATRWLASRKLDCHHLILHSGGIPVELKPSHFEHLSSTTRVTYLYGDRDEYITEARETEEQLKASALFGDRLNVHVFEGTHEVNRAFLRRVAAR